MRLFHPFAAIARELAIIRELYEMDLANRTPPLIRCTEAPGKNDTTVTYADEDEKKSERERLSEEWLED